jgi:hypothetical protein
MNQPYAPEPRRGLPLRVDGDALLRVEVQAFRRSIAARVLAKLGPEPVGDVIQRTGRTTRAL